MLECPPCCVSGAQPWNSALVPTFRSCEFPGFPRVCAYGWLTYMECSYLVGIRSDGNSNAITAKVSGREAMFGTIAKLLAVVGGQVADDHPIMVATVMTCSYAILGLYVIAQKHTPQRCSRCVHTNALECSYVASTLPFFNPYMNQFRVAASFLVASVSFGSVILSIVKPASPGTFSAIWIGCTVVITALAGQLPRLRMQQLHARLVSMRPRMLEELDQKHKYVWVARQVGDLAHHTAPSALSRIGGTPRMARCA